MLLPSCLTLLLLSVSDPASVTLPEALARARAHHPTLEAARLRVEAARKELAVVDASWLPTVGVLAEVVGSSTNNSTTTVLSNGAVDLPRIGATRVSATPDFTPAVSTVLAVGARQLIYDFGRLAAQREAANAGEALERARLDGARLDVDLAVRRAFYAVLAAHAVLEASTQAQTRARAHRDFAKTAVEAQVRPPIELTRAEADLERATVGQLKAASGLRSARLVLASLVGDAALELDAVGASEPPAPLPEPEWVKTQALDADPSLREAAAELQVSRAQAEQAAAQRRPNLFATAALSGRNGGAAPSSGTAPAGYGLVPAVPNYDLGVVFSWPLLDLAATERQAAAGLRADARAATLQAQRDRATERALLLLEQARVTTEALGALERTADAARANGAQAEARFRAGLGTSTELADAETLRTEAEINVAIGRFDALTARAALDRALATEKP